MSFLERLFHAILFETTVVLLSVFALYFFTEESVSILLWFHGAGFLNSHAMESHL